MKKFFKGKKILVTGGSGSIGSEIVRQSLKYSPGVVRIFSNDETGQFDFQHELENYENIRFLLGDVRDKDRLKMAIQDIDIVFHAAALKHVPACEYNPFEAVKTNIIGTQNVIEAALNEDIDKLIAISSDKAAAPGNTMGASKLLSEKLVIAANHYKGSAKTVFSCVRFGNVMNSRGSVIPLFKRQIQDGVPITVTDLNMTRFVMSISQAVNLVIRAAYMARGGEVFILKMPALRLGDLVEVIMETLAPRYKYSSGKIKIIGARPGEKLYEELMTEDEAARAYETDDMFITLPQIRNDEMEASYKETIYPISKPAKIKKYTSNDGDLLTKEEIKKLLQRDGLL